MNIETITTGLMARLVAISVITGFVLDALAQPVITKQPLNQTSSLFGDATFRAIATGDAPLSYQWRFNEIDLRAETNAILTVTNVQRPDAGNYTVVVTNLSGRVTSQIATLTITPFNSLYCFGFSWTQTTGVNCNAPAAEYYKSRLSNGPVWPEFLSFNLGLAYAQSNNYAFCGATSSDVLNQVNNNLRMPAKPALSLYCLWACDSEFLKAIPPNGSGFGYLNLTNQIAWNLLIRSALSNNSNAINRLYLRGAREILVENIFDYSQLPYSVSTFGKNTGALAAYSGYCAQFNASLVDLIQHFHETNADLRIIYVDIFSKLREVIANPTRYNFTKTTVDALDDPKLTNKSFSGPGADYVFWDVTHPTSKLHELMAAWHLEALTNSVLEKLDITVANGTSEIQMNHLRIGRDYEMQISNDLRQWQDFQTFTAVAGTNQWSGPLGNDSTAYFRLTWQR